MERSISAREFRLPIAHGAAEDRELQVLRATADEQRVDRSLPCDDCDRLVLLGAEPRAAACFCGRGYRVVFDLDVLNVVRAAGARASMRGLRKVAEGDESGRGAQRLAVLLRALRAQA